jgi:diguanylate cyclase (GGDEF)-like protein
VQAASSPEERIVQALTDWRTREGTLLLVVYGVIIAALCPGFYLLTRMPPGNFHDSLPLRLASTAVSLLLVLAVAIFPGLRPRAHRLQILNVTVFLVVIMALLVNSGNSLWYLTLAIIALFGVQYAFLRWQDIALAYIIAIDFEIVYSSVRAGFGHHTNMFAIAAVAFTSAICVASGVLRMRAQQADIESRTRLEIQTEEVHRQAQRIRHLAYSDSLTGLANRVGMNDRVDRALQFASRHNLMAALLYLDLDGFKEINDTHGHDIGDVVLLGAALRIQYVLRHGESIGRIGGDEFVVLIPSIESPEDAQAVIRRIVDVLHEPFSVGDQQFVLSASIGTAIFPRDGGTRLELLAHADNAMYSIKRERRRQLVAGHNPA